MTGVAVKVTWVPAHTGFADTATDTLTRSNGFTVMVIVFEVAGFPVVQVSLDVKTQLIVFLSAGIKTYVALVAPDTVVPFINH